MAIFVVFWGIIAIFKYLNGGYNGLDLAIYNNTFWNTAHGHLFASSINIPSYLGDHAEWYILPLSLIYAIFPHPLTLIILQILALAAAAIPIYLIAKHLLSNKKYAIIFPLIWLLNFTVCYNTLWEFHMLTFSLVFVFFAAYYFIQKKFWQFLLFLFLGFLVREDVAFISISFALVYLADRGAWAKGNRIQMLKWTVLPLALGALVFFADIKIITAMNANGIYKYASHYFAGFGQTAGQVVLNAILHPLPILLKLFSPTSLKIIFVSLAVFLFLPLRRPRFLLLSPISYLIISTANNNDWFLPLQTHYALLMFPGIVIAAIYGFQSLQNDAKQIIPKPLLAPLAVFAPLFFLFTLGPITAIPKIFAAPSATEQAQMEAVALVPPNASVSSSFDAATLLSGREKFYYLYYAWVGKNEFFRGDYAFPELPEYLLINERFFLANAPGKNNIVGEVFEQALAGDERFRKILANGEYQTIFEKNGVVLLKKGNGDGSYPFINLLSAPPANTTKSLSSLSPELDLIGYKKNQNGWKLYFKTNGTLDKYTVIKINGEILPFGQGIFPPEKISTGKIIEYSYSTFSDKVEIRLFTGMSSFSLLRDETNQIEFSKLNALGATATLP